MKNISEIKGLLQPFLSEQNKSYKKIAEFLAKNLTMTLSAADIAELLTVIESVKVGNSSSLGEIIKSKKQSILANFSDLEIGLPSDFLKCLTAHSRKKANFASFSQDKDKKFLKTLEEIHRNLTAMLKKVLTTINSDNAVPVYTLEYSKDMLENSLAYKKLEAKSKEAQLPDASTIVQEMGRGITLHKGELVEDKIIFTPFPMPRDPDGVRENLEAFTGDLIETKGSQANKIFYFGNQTNYATFLQEFLFATEYNGRKVGSQFNEGSLEWRRFPDGKIEALVTIEIFCLYIDGELYLVNSEGSGLEKFSQKGLSDINLKNETSNTSKLSDIYLKDKDSKTSKLSDIDLKDKDSRIPVLRAPVGSIKAKLELVKDEKGEYYLKPTQSTIKYNIPELKCIRQPRSIPKFPMNLESWEIVKSLNKIDIDKVDDILHFINLLQSLNKNEWSTLKKYVDSKGDNAAIKLAQIFIKSQMYNCVEDDYITSEIKSNLKELLGGETSFNKYHAMALEELNLGNYVSRFTEFFKKLKTNSLELNIQEPVAIIRDLIKDESSEDNIKAKLAYFFNQVHQQPGFCLTQHDLNKIKKLESIVEQLYPRNEMASLFYKLRFALVSQRIQPGLTSETASFTFRGKTTREIPSQENENEFINQVINATIVNSLNEIDIDKIEDISLFNKLLQTLSKEQWSALKNYIHSKKYNVGSKLVSIFIKSQMNGLTGNEQETLELKNNLLRFLGGENSFNQYRAKAFVDLKLSDYMTRFTEFFKKLKVNSPSLCLQEPISIISDLLKDDSAGKDIEKKLIFFLKQVNQQENFKLTKHDLEKIEKINAQVETSYKESEISRRFKLLYSALSHASVTSELSSETVNFPFHGQHLKEIPLRKNENVFANYVILTTEATAYLKKIKAAQTVIKTQLPNFKDNEQFNALKKLDSELEKSKARVTEYGREKFLSSQFLKDEIQKTHQQILIASLKDKTPTSLFGKLIESIKNIFRSKRPSILDTLKDVETKVSADYPKF